MVSGSVAPCTIAAPDTCPQPLQTELPADTGILLVGLVVRIDTTALRGLSS